MNWDDARYFLAVARDGQMLSAANKLGVSQSKLSRHLTAFEAAAGRRLMERSTRGCTLTEDGQVFFLAAERIEAELLRAQADLSDNEQLQGTIRLGVPDGLGGGFLAKKLGSLRALSPKLRVQLVPLPHQFSLAEREADIAIMVGRPQRGRLRIRKLTDFTLGLYAAESYLLRAGVPETVEQLSQHDLVGYVSDLIYSPELRYADEILPGWTSDIEVATASGQVEAVNAGAGIGLLHDFLAVEQKGIKLVLPKIKVKRTYWTVWHEDLSGIRRVESTVEFLSNVVRAHRSLFLPKD